VSIEAASRSNRISEHVAQILSDWWTRPDPSRIAVWATSAYKEKIAELFTGENGDSVALDQLLAAIATEKNLVTAEYERLFVGPAAPPCPPYEALWHTNRPQQEEGTVLGKSTEEVRQIYRKLGLQSRPTEKELVDHIAIELEALGYALGSGASAEVAEELAARFQVWLPTFCSSVKSNSHLMFYRALADLTLRFVTNNNHTSSNAEESVPPSDQAH
jgi:TorA maturation chaperone TorD